MHVGVVPDPRPYKRTLLSRPGGLGGGASPCRPRDFLPPAFVDEHARHRAEDRVLQAREAEAKEVAAAGPTHVIRSCIARRIPVSVHVGVAGTS